MFEKYKSAIEEPVSGSFFTIFGLIPLKAVVGAWAVLHHYITSHEQTQLNRVSYFR